MTESEIGTLGSHEKFVQILSWKSLDDAGPFVRSDSGERHQRWRDVDVRGDGSGTESTKIVDDAVSSCSSNGTGKAAPVSPDR